MNFNLTEEQEMIKKMARDFLTQKCPKSVIKQLEADKKGYSPELWQEMADLGWMGLVLPEKYGGGGMSFFDLAILLEEMGRAALPGPFFSTVILGALPIMDAGSDAQKQEFLPKISSGKAIFTLALTEADARYEPASIQVKAAAGKNGYTINGTKLFVPDAHIADYLLCAARTVAGKGEDGITLFIVDARSPGISYSVLQTIGKDKQCKVVFNNVNVPAENILGKLNKGWIVIKKVLERAALAKCCETLGSMEQMQEMTVSYAKERVQFDHPIGILQIVQHHCSDIVTDVEGCRLGTYQAAWKMSEGLPCTREIAVAKTWTNQASERVITLSHQIHGAVGFTMDHDLHFYSMRSKGAAVTYGDAEYHKEVVAQEMGL